MQALSAASWEMLEATPEQDAAATSDTVACLIYVAACGPAAIAGSSELQAALTARVQQAEVSWCAIGACRGHDQANAVSYQPT